MCQWTHSPFGWVVVAAAGWGGAGGVWAGPGLVWMRSGVLAAARLRGGRLLAAGHRSSIAVCHCGAVVGGPFAGGRTAIGLPSQSVIVGEVGRCVVRGAVAGGRRRGRPPGRGPLQQACGFTAV
jgi:hypothetical protein